MIGPGAVIGGPVIVGDYIIIGANAVVTRDVPPHSMVIGNNQISSKRIRVDTRGLYSILVG